MFLEPFLVDGKLYGIPADVSVQYIVYNKELLAKQGLPFPQPGWTFDEMLNLASRVSNRTASVPTFGLAIEADTLLEARNTKWYDNSVTPPRALFNTTELSNSLVWLNNLYQEGTFLPMYGASLPEEMKPQNYTPYEQAIANGQVAMWTASSSSVSSASLPFEIGYVPLPNGVSGTRMSYPINPMGYYISRNSKNPEACWQWIHFLSERPSFFGGYTPRISVISGQNGAGSHEQMEVVQSALRDYVRYPYADKYDPLLRPYLNSIFEIQLAVLKGQNTPQVLAEMQKKADAYYGCLSQKSLSGLDDTQLYNQVVLPCANATVP